MKNILLVVFFGLFFIGSSLAQYKIPATPNKQTSVMIILNYFLLLKQED
jgi:hypothetical protein